MKEIFDFGAIKGLLQGSGGKPPLNVLINSMHGGKIKQIKDYCPLLLLTVKA
jgi:hypothetical protein